MKISKKGLLAVATLPVLAAGIVIGAANANAFNFQKVGAKTLVDLSEDTITRRIWIVNADDWHWSNHYVYAWNTKDNKINTTVEFTGWVDFSGTDSYYSGLAYADVTFKGAGDEIGVIVKNAEDWNGTSTVDNTLPALSASGADVIYLNSGYTDTKRNSEVKTAPMSTGQIAKTLATIRTCQTGYHNGYNAYPQLNKDFFIPSASEIEQYAAGTDVEDGYKLNQKIAKLEALYTAEGWYTE